MQILKQVAKENKLTIAIYLAIGLTTSFLGSFTAKYFQILVDNFTAGTFTLGIVAIYGASYISLYLLHYIDNIPDNKLQHGIYLDLKLAALKKVSRIDYLAYQNIGTGQLIQRIENGADAGVNMLYGFWLRIIRELLPTMIFSVLFIFGISKVITVTIIAGYAVVFCISNLLLKALYSVKERILDNEEKLNRYLVRGFMELVVFRLNKRFAAEINKARAAKDEIVAAKVKMRMIHEAFFTIFAILVAFVKIAMIVYAWQSRSLSIGAVVALIALVDSAYTPIAIFNVLYVQYKLDKTAFGRYKEYINASDDENLTNGSHIAAINGDISCNSVTFKYGERLILDNFNLSIQKGAAIAFVGESGSGKSTIAKLLTGLIKPIGGNIRIGDRHLSSLQLNSYYDHIFYISQDAPVFDGTLRENIVFDNAAEDKSILEALAKVGLSELYSKLEQGMETRLGEKGLKLSGGERQRLALARLWFSAAQIIILDEATSAMDNITEQNVMREITAHLRGKTIIAIAHRLSSIKDFDTIIAIQNGEVVANGTFEQLLISNEYFNELYKKERKDNM